jgi:hypothetical protein
MSNHTARARAGQDRATLYDEITDRIIAELEAGRVPWVQPWGTAAAKAPLAVPKNVSTDRQYSGLRGRGSSEFSTAMLPMGSLALSWSGLLRSWHPKLVKLVAQDI